MHPGPALRHPGVVAESKAGRCWERWLNTHVSPLWAGAAGHPQVSCTAQIFILLFIPH